MLVQMTQINYTEVQKRAINHKDGNLQIIACSGSGKTEVISRRIARIIESGASPKNIVAFTFTEKAAEELKFTIREHLEELCPENPELGEMFVGTIHSFCFDLLKNLKPRYRGFEALDEHKRMLFLSDYGNFYRVGLNNLGQKSYRQVERFCRSVDVVRQEMIDIKKLPNDFKECYQKYEELLQEERFLDFSSMIHKVVKLLKEDDDFFSEVREKYKYMTVDEYQDVNPLQEELIRLMAGKNGNLCVVGDDDQCIYQWRGTTVENILSFQDRYNEVDSVKLEENFRSSKAVIETAREEIKNNSERLQKEMKPSKSRNISYDKGDIYSVFFDKEKEEINFVINKIKALRGTKFTNNKGETFTLDYRDIAILFRSVKTSGAELVEALRENDIDYIVKGAGELFKRKIVKIAVKSLAYIGGFSYDGKATLEELGKLYESIFSEKGNVSRYLQGIENLKEGLEKGSWISLQEVYQRLLFHMGITKFGFSETQLYNLGKLSEVITDFESVRKRVKVKDIKYLLGFIKGHGEGEYEEGGQEDPTKINAVKVMTVHRAKGLEFPVVFIPHLVSGRFPSQTRSRTWFIPEELFDKERYEGSIEDERRLFYVAMTRSQKYLFITGSRKIRGLKRDKSPSQFFQELPKEYSLQQPVEDPTEREKSEKPMEQKLRGFPTSYSELRYYDRCPYDYKLRHIYGFNPKIVMALGYGRSVHNILNIIHNRFRETPPTPEELDEIVDKNFYLRYAPDAQQEIFKRTARKIVKNYAEKFSGSFRLVLESEKPFEFTLGIGLISGSIDLIKRLDESGEVEGIEIVDFKEKDDTEMATDYRKQLKLYALASIQSLGLNPKQATIHHLDENSKSTVDISQKELKRTREEVKDEIKKITERKFPKRSSGKKCRKCDFKFICDQKSPVGD